MAIHPSRWQCGGRSVIGAMHQRTGQPNQDALAWRSDSSLPLILAVADGHGSAKSFRSHRGSELAVQIAVEEMGKFLSLHSSEQWTEQAIAQMAELARETLPQHLVQTWQSTVLADYQSHPFRAAEWSHLQAREPGLGEAEVRDNPLLAYGSTLLAVAVTDAFLLYLQLGDGDILQVDRQGTTQRALAKDSRLIANVTTSLCTEAAWREMQIQVLPLTEQPPRLILLSSDGYANSFVSEADFLQTGRDYLRWLEAEGMAAVMNQLDGILSETSQQGSGDDITLGMIQCLSTGQERPGGADRTVPHRAVTPKSTPTLPLTQRERFAATRLGPTQRSFSRVSTIRPLEAEKMQALQRGMIGSLVLSVLALGVSIYSLWLQLQKAPPAVPAAATPSPPVNSPLPWAAIYLKLSGEGAIPLRSGGQLYLNQGRISLMPLQGDQLPIAAVVLVPGSERLALKNLSQQVWQITHANGARQTLAPQQQIEMENQLQLRFDPNFPHLVGQVQMPGDEATEATKSRQESP
uniref:PPM-type phosphatase domain-containing protein n=1 Tax=Cyanothece sp. (strain PCC 7425 / ATCC 29141) TaxID=395961 RepID=B8HT04_CYAP4